MKTVRRPPYPKWNPGYFPCSSLTPLPLSSRRPSVSFGGFGLKELHRESLARCKQSLTILGVPDDIADEIALDPPVGYELILPTAGSQLVVGGQGVGKTLAVERLFQNAIGDALGDSSKPSPIFVRAMDLNGTLRDYVENVTRGYAFPTAQGALVVIDGLDEVGTANANRLLSDVLPYVEANPNITVVEKWLRKSEQGDKWNRCLIEGMIGGYVNRCVNDIRRRPSQPLIQWRFHPHTVHRGRRLRSTQGPSDA